jgi:Domain of unknown function (DUF4124)
MSGFARVLLAMLLVAPVAFADSIYVCKQSDGKVVYRDFPCPADAESTAFSGPAGAASNSAKGSAGDPSQQLRSGMSQGEVRSLLGNPTEIIQEEGVDGRVDTWSYGAGSKTLQFDATGHLVK